MCKNTCVMPDTYLWNDICYLLCNGSAVLTLPRMRLTLQEWGLSAPTRCPHFTHHPQAQGFPGHPHFWTTDYKLRGFYCPLWFNNLLQGFRELRKVLTLQLQFYYSKKKKKRRRRERDTHIVWVWEGPKNAASVSSSCGVRMHHLPGTLMCNNMQCY